MPSIAGTRVMLTLAINLAAALAIAGEVTGATQATPPPIGGTQERAEYLGFDFTSQDARDALTEYLTAVGSARTTYLENLDSLRVRSLLAEIEAEHQEATKQALEKLLSGLEKELEGAISRGDTPRALYLSDLVESFQDDGPAPPRLHLGSSKPKEAKKRFEGHHYLLVPERNTWHVAAQHCEQLGGYLACIETLEERAFLAKWIQDERLNVKGFYVGATDMGQEGTWTWLTVGQVGSEWWVSGNPNNVNSRVAAAIILETGLLGSWHSGWREPFICEWGGVPTYGGEILAPAEARLFRTFWETCEAASASKQEDVAGIEKKVARARKKYERLIEDATKLAIKKLNRAMRTETKRGNLDEALALSDALEELGQGGHFTLKPLAAEALPDGVTAHRGSHFKLMNETLPWHLARDRCRELGGRLAIARTIEDVEFLTDLIGKQASPAWVGATDEVKEGHWVWEDGGEGVPADVTSITIWIGAEHALILHKGMLHDVVADGRRSYICEWPWYW